MNRALFTIVPYFSDKFYKKINNIDNNIHIYIIIIDDNIKHINISELSNNIKILFMRDLDWKELNYKHIAFGFNEKDIISILKCAGFYYLFSENYSYEYIAFIAHNRISHPGFKPEQLFENFNEPADYHAVLIPRNIKKTSPEKLLLGGSWEDYFHAFKKTPAVIEFMKIWFSKSVFYGTFFYPDNTVTASDFFLNLITAYTDKIKHYDRTSMQKTREIFTSTHCFDFYNDGERILEQERINYRYIHPSEKIALGDPFSQRHKISKLRNIDRRYVEITMLFKKLNNIFSLSTWIFIKLLKRIFPFIERFARQK